MYSTKLLSLVEIYVFMRLVASIYCLFCYSLLYIVKSRSVFIDAILFLKMGNSHNPLREVVISGFSSALPVGYDSELILLSRSSKSYILQE